jgi:hypothetical protein
VLSEAAVPGTHVKGTEKAEKETGRRTTMTDNKNQEEEEEELVE